MRTHQNSKVFAGHKVANLADLKKGGAKEIALKEAPLAICPEHDEPMKIFCFDCNRLVCRDCVLYDHREHKSDFVKKCASESRKTLYDSLAPLRKVQADIAGAEKAVLVERDVVTTQNVEVCKSLLQSFDKLRLNQREAELVGQRTQSDSESEWERYCREPFQSICQDPSHSTGTTCTRD